MPAFIELHSSSIVTALSAIVDSIGIHDASILTGGIQAKGHGFFIDDTSLDQFMQLALGKSVSSYLTHAGMASDRLGNEMGIFSGFYRDGNQIRAKNFQFTDSFIKHNQKEYDTITQLADQFPDQLGISPVILHGLAWVLDDGSEVDADDNEKPENAIRDIPSARIGRIKSADFVKNAAANIALFSEKQQLIDKTRITMDEKTISLVKHQEALSAKDTELTALSEKHTTALAKMVKDHEAALSAKDEAHKTALAAAETKLKTDHAAALNIVIAERDDAKTFDMRLAGAPAIEAALTEKRGLLPKPASTDRERWEQHAALAEKDPAAAETFKQKYLILNKK